MYKLLIVDDEPLTREYMKLNISSIDSRWEVAGEAEDGAEALGFLENHPVDLVITDIKMPVMDGLELCREISKKIPQQKVVILSGYDEFTFAKEAILYGVSEYLLKPIVKDNLKAALESVTQKLEKEKHSEIAYRSLLHLSKDSKNYVVKKFLQALIYDCNAEIKTLYPLIHRMKVSLIEGEGIIMVLALDEEEIVKKDIPLSDIPIYRYILNQVATEITEDNHLGYVFFDSDENTCILVTSDDASAVSEICKKIYFEVSTFMIENTGITISAGTGAPVSDILQFSTSYKRASSMLLFRLICRGGSLYPYEESDTALYSRFVNDITKVIPSLKSGFLANDELSYSLAINTLTDLMPDYTISTVLKWGLYIIYSLSKLKINNSAEQSENVLKILRTVHANAAAEMTKADTVKLFKEVVTYLVTDPSCETHRAEDTPLLNEQNIIEKAKEYIYCHYSEPISLALIAEKEGVSSSYLSQLFHKTVGESYIKFLTRVRMEQAAKLLKAYPQDRISDICERVGYIGVKHFSYVFKQYFNMTPGEYQSKFSS